MQAKELITFIQQDRGHGASELGFVALQGINVVAQQWSGQRGYLLKKQLLQLLDELAAIRPSMIALNHLLGQLSLRLKNLETADVNSLKTSIARLVDEIAEKARAAQLGTAKKMADRIVEGDVIMSFSVSSTIKQVFSEAESRIGRVYIPESRPGNEGLLLAQFLNELHVDTICITESQINLFMPECDKVLVGADAVLGNGDVVNKAGTSLMALSAHYHRVPFFVCAESFKHTRRATVPLEEMDVAELGISVEGVSARNVYFDVTPDALITSIVRD